ncbi:magnesium transporter [Anaerobaca lacustris]|uniref:Magnesium transporter MgtE n=1 Tax=Anaerobaca lacustris TaxID=3044600 RepID=A0AAW6TWZ7_9BACT|nr:magnesium transporter [Sedimentisphaerales bacterium M17dextr]
MAEMQEQLLHEISPLLERERLATLRELLYDWRTSDIAEIVELVDDDRRRLIFDVLEIPVAAEVLEKVNEATRDRLFEILTEEEIHRVFSELDWDDAADLLAEMPEDIADKAIRSLSLPDRLQVHKLMRYSEDSAGGIMDPVVISVSEDATVAEAVSKIRMAEIDEDFYSVYVVDCDGRFIGEVRLRFLLTRRENTRIGDLVDRDTIYVRTDTDQEQVRNVFRKNDLLVVPVLDEDHKLAGRITADRVIEVAEEEAVEDIYTMAGTNPEELDTFSALRAARIRMTWLLPCLLGTGVTAIVMNLFGTYDPRVYLAAAAFVPMIAAISGNAGLQTSAIVVSGLATGHLVALKLSTVFSREVRIALLVATACGLVGAVICSVLIHYRSAQNTIEPVRLVLAFGGAMFSAIMVATTLGLFLPFVFRRIGIDPAISSGPLVTTANDSISVAIFMTLAVTLAS